MDATLSRGIHTITAIYSGDTNFSGSTSSPMTQTVVSTPLQVTSFTPTATGFVATFNRSLKLAIGPGGMLPRSCISMITPLDTWVPLT